MLLEFTVGNYLSFKDPVTLSMVAAKVKSEDSDVDQNNTFPIEKNVSLLTSAAVYGANASGKSNLVKALRFMQWLVLNSSKESLAGSSIKTIPFRLDERCMSDPSHFEIVFSFDDVVYRYGFEVNSKRVIAEWCFYSPKGKESRLFYRHEDEITISRNFKGGAKLKELTRPNALFLSVATQFNNEIANKLSEWFDRLIIIRGLSNSIINRGTPRMLLEVSQFQQLVKNLIQKADMGIDNLIAEKVTVPSDSDTRFPDDMPQEVRDYFLKHARYDQDTIQVHTLHKVQTENGTVKEVLFDIDEESDGTQKFFYLTGPIIDSLLQQRVLVIDEIEASMHTLLTRYLVNLYNSNESNSKHAQLVFTSHDTNLLDKKHFRRDQIWFVEKDNIGASHLYSLAELKVRNDATFENDYLRGKYGGVPILGKLHELWNVPQGDDCVEA